MVCRLPWRTRTDTLLRQIGWMRVRQMAIYYSIINLFKIRQTGVPQYIYQMVSAAFTLNTRLADSGSIRDTRKFQKSIPCSSFLPRTINSWNMLPASIKMEKKPNIFAQKLQIWVKNHH